MRHNVKGRKLGRTASHKKALMRTLVTQLLEYKRIHTTEAKAKELRPYAEKIITKARIAYQREQQGLLPDGQTHDVHTRRLLGRDIRKKSVIENLFDEIIPEIGDRPGGYTRIVKTGIRKGDAGRAALIELVDYNRDIVAATNKKAKKKSTQKVAKDTTTVTKIEEAVEVAEDTNEEIVDVAEVSSVEISEIAQEKAEEISEVVSETVEEVTEAIEDKIEEIVEAASETTEVETSTDETKSEDETNKENNDEDKKTQE
jgi:large subunit ribosomal protein L17